PSKECCQLNQTTCSPNRTMILDYVRCLSPTGELYWPPRACARSGRSLELNSTHPNQVASVSVAFAATQQALYNIALRIWDGLPANHVSVTLDGAYNHQLSYNGTSLPVSATVFSGTLTKGVHTLTLSVGDDPTISQYLS